MGALDEQRTWKVRQAPRKRFFSVATLARALPRRRAIKRLALYALVTITFYKLSKLLLPADHPVYLAVNWILVCIHSFFHSTSSIDSWLLTTKGSYPVDFASRVGILVKTGYGTRERLPAQLEALGLREWDPERAVAVADFAGELNLTVGTVPVRDAVGELMEYLEPRGWGGAERFKKYVPLRDAIVAGDEDRALSIGRNVGWELDALKFIWGLGILHKTTPAKDWYLILDDDTYIIPQSLMALLSHLDPSKPHYLGNSVGDYRGRFAHGGSAVALSRAAVDTLYRLHGDVTYEAHVNSLTETWGDRLLATTLQKIGVFVDERFNHLFNGESALDTRIWTDRFCAPLVSFHELKRPEDMRAVGARLEGLRGPVLWSDVWPLFGGGEMTGFNGRPMREGRDHVGKLTEGVSRTTRGVGTAEKCMKLCMRDRRRCLAWRWDSGSGECHTAPWMIVGREVEGAVAGINGAWAADLRDRCRG
ncbi:uncharacterized protein DNG_06707 [Cephalotrichum gorgonifer]|uniref:N-acetylgalactosaminide beta-1,3-galactosyltransferase n=1 Tax=Cephalotrichum gorgonifer TaxID=2041049 RepID=A0AAE8N217_9PEZI|nr:uncharacterized protein DNG_06707 [Cephalotrichum gorgonifer]